MKPPFVHDDYHPYRPPKSLRELKRRRKRKQGGDEYMSLFDRVFYAILNGLMYAFIGFLLDGTVTVIRSVMNVGDGSIYWLFAPFLAVIGVIVGFFAGKWAGADSVDAFNSDAGPDLDTLSIRHDIIHGIGFGIFFFFVLWLIMLVAM